MEGPRTNSAQDETDINSETRDIYVTGNSGACKTWHGGSHVSAKLGVNKGRI